MAQFVLMLRDTGRFPGTLSPEEIQAVVTRYSAWADKLRAAGKISAGQKLCDGEGRVVRRNGSGLGVTDGPFAEAKEILGGFFVLDVNDYDEALALSQDCPHLDFGSIEVRRVDFMK
ncbi:MAG TPA: YciI family protein [Thermoanaerobaculia bacterium]|nr:YciI family protein [Thermoanaerobaculia bacterium]